ncbi:MAG: glycosyltransferase family 2 protein [Parasphingorhabdus sp.]
MRYPEVTIITPCYNAGNYLKQCIQSVQSQGFEDWEHLIVDDQSDDESRDIIGYYQRRDDRVKMLVSSDKLGASKARNLAITHANGRYIAFLDADDWWSHDKLAKQISHMKTIDAHFCCTAYNVVDQAGTLLRLQGISKLGSHRLLTKRAVVGCLTVIYDREYFADFLFSEDMSAVEDYEMWCRMLIYLEKSGGKCEAMPEPLAYYRTHAGGKSHKKMRRVKLHYDVYRNRLQLPFAYAGWCTLGYIVNGVRDRMWVR